MRPLVASAEALRLDAAVQEAWALQPLVLMENAAARLWLALEPRLGEAGRASPLVALAGGGNNGGDALALLRQARFAGRTDLAAIVAAERMGELAALQRRSLEAAGIAVLSWTEEGDRARGLVGRAGLLLDGLCGAGLKGGLRGPAAGLAAFAAASGRPVAAIDLPSGLSDSMEPDFPVLRSAFCLSIEPRKASLYYPGFREAAGEIVAVEGVFPRDADLEPSAFLLEEGDLAALAPRPDPAAHKGLRGRLAVFAGSPGASGAAIFASKAAQAASAGLVCLYAPSALYGPLSSDASALGGALVREEEAAFGLPGSVGEDGAFDAVLAGPGWGFRSSASEEEAKRSDSERARLLERLLASGLPAVLDAGALRLLPLVAPGGWKPHHALILTPHPGEFAALSGIPAREVLASPEAPLLEAARRYGAVVVLKAAVTWIAAPDGRLAVYDGREPSLACAGSGDVLAGAAAGLLASRAAAAPVGLAASASPVDLAFDAARGAVLAHGLAGRRARARLGWYEAGALPGELARLLSEALP
ncbi:MAG TPA: NAD(P)H-hydrate dehydratase [Spirochaetales bacterium]|nr:NAD(P)H-hydrate dehydratase [Spirochaetales bacterium]